MEKEVDKEEMKRCLKDANIYEENLTDDLITEFYKAIKNSETSIQEESEHNRVIMDESEKSLNDSANELLEAINNSESIAPSRRHRYDISDDMDSSLNVFSPDVLEKATLDVALDEPNNNNNNSVVHPDDKCRKVEVKESIPDIKYTHIGFNDMPKSQKTDKNMLKIISHELKFINIQNSKKYLIANSETRIKLLYNYHNAAAKLRAYYTSLSTNMAPIGKPITAISHDLCANPTVSSLKDEEVQLATESTYISRAGRMTKRKVYNEIDDPPCESKRTKNDNEWLSKNTSKGKAAKANLKKNESSEVIVNNNSNNINNGILNKIPNKTHTKVKRSDSPDSSQDVSLSGFLDDCEKARESTPVGPKPRTYQRKMSSNEDIMNRCALFKDTAVPIKGRTALILNAAKEEAKKKKQHEEVMTKFIDSLVLDSETLDDESQNVISDDDEQERKRVIPPLPSARKSIHSRKRSSAITISGAEPLNISTKKPSLNNNNSRMEEPKARTVNGLDKKSSVTRSWASNNNSNNNNNNNNNVDRGEPSSSSSSTVRGKKDVLMTPCPLCSVSFPQKDIEEHAATCGEDLFPQTSQPKRITCEVCDSVVPFTTEYEVHVKACIAKRNQGV